MTYSIDVDTIVYTDEDTMCISTWILTTDSIDANRIVLCI